ncbi:MAG: glycolate oxidase subunit GlcF [Alphaproteobacteria bacterium]
MQTSFTLAQLADPQIEEADRILRKCVHCGFCTATCPTYVLLGDELDGPRGRIMLIKAMLETTRPPTAKVVTHIDRCLSCLSCMTTCPSGVDYRRLVDRARAHIDDKFHRPWAETMLRGLLAMVLPRPPLFRAALLASRLLPDAVARLLPGRLAGLAAMAPARVPGPSTVGQPQTHSAQEPRRLRVALMPGCAQQVLAPAINDATVRVLTRHGCEVVVARGGGCCGALVHHLGQEDAARDAARRNVAAWSAEVDNGGLDAIVINASGCGTTIKDYGHLLKGDPRWAAAAARVAGLARDVSEILADLDIEPDGTVGGLSVAYHSACSLQHGQNVHEEPRRVLAAAGFTVREIAEGHLCCGSAGTYNLLQPDISERLLARKLANVERCEADVVATGNIGCMVQLARATDTPVVHTVELVDWATGGPRPEALGDIG